MLTLMHLPGVRAWASMAPPQILHAVVVKGCKPKFPAGTPPSFMVRTHGCDVPPKQCLRCEEYFRYVICSQFCYRGIALFDLCDARLFSTLVVYRTNMQSVAI